MTRWVTADHHFFHANIIKYTNRPFYSVAEMNAELVRLWNDLIARHDEVLYIGDFAFYKKDPEGCQALFRNLNGRKTLIRGSHDQYMDELPWEAIAEYGLRDGVHLIHEGVPFLREHPELDEQPIFCGHVHEIWKMRGNLLNVGVDVWHFRPVEWEAAKAYWQNRFDYYIQHGKDA